MPFYEYFCSANNKTIEVKHGMTERLKTWKEVCELAAIPLENTPGNTPVERLLSVPMILEKGKASAKPSRSGPCSHGGCGCMC